ncbi:hypothetical protein RB653_003465 [Dictyostelium firmibasis]|uniref:Cytochrome P450 n=1 Tax=Dictyostelium firmibasis TaxID=79012 RepID=A0AAN7Z2I8_9MYCE
MEILNVLILLVFIFLLKDFIKKNKKVHPKSPSGPLAFPIIGNIPQLKFKEFLFNKQEHTIIGEYSQSNDGICRAYLGDRYFLFISNYDVVKCIQKDDNFMDRPSKFVPGWRYISNNGMGIMSSSEEKWTRAKTLVIKSLRIHSKKELIEEKAKELIDSLDKCANSNEIIYPKEYFQGYSCSILFKYMFNQEIPVKNEQSKAIGNAIEHVFSNISKLTAFDCFEFLSPFYDWFFEKRLKGCDIVRHIINSQNDKHLESIDPSKPRDLMDDLLIEYGVNEITQEDRTQINQICFDIFGPSVGTITITLNWVILQLCNHQDLQEIVYNEIKNAVVSDGSEYVNMSHKQSIPYLVAFIKETMRLCSNGFGLPKTAKKDQICGNYLIPKDAIIFVNYLAISLNEELFSNPHEFNPKRYLDESIPIPNIHFGVGPRACPGRFIAIDEMFLAVSNILLKYKIKSVDGKKIDDSIQFSVSLKAKDYCIKLEKRKQ